MAQGHANYVGMPAGLYLEEFGSQVWNAFRHPAYLVGSAMQSRDWRDVDVRLILPDEEYAALFPGRAPEREHTCGKWTALVLAFSPLGQKMTGLPIDFQIQQQTRANALHTGPRSALGFVALRLIE